MTQWAHAVIRGPLVAGGPGRIGAPDRLGPLVAKAQGGPRVTWGPFREQVAPPGRNPGYVPVALLPYGCAHKLSHKPLII